MLPEDAPHDGLEQEGLWVVSNHGRSPINPVQSHELQGNPYTSMHPLSQEYVGSPPRMVSETVVNLDSVCAGQEAAQCSIHLHLGIIAHDSRDLWSLLILAQDCHCTGRLSLLGLPGLGSNSTACTCTA